MQSNASLIIVAFIIVFDVVLNCLYGWNLYYAVKQLPHTACSNPEMNKLRYKLLHMVEFVMLAEYVECMVPLMYLVWMWVSLLGPNRPYWNGLTQEDISIEKAHFYLLTAKKRHHIVVILEPNRLNPSTVSNCQREINKY